MFHKTSPKNVSEKKLDLISADWELKKIYEEIEDGDKITIIPFVPTKTDNLTKIELWIQADILGVRVYNQLCKLTELKDLLERVKDIPSSIKFNIDEDKGILCFDDDTQESIFFILGKLHTLNCAPNKELMVNSYIDFVKPKMVQVSELDLLFSFLDSKTSKKNASSASIPDAEESKETITHKAIIAKKEKKLTKLIKSIEFAFDQGVAPSQTFSPSSV